MDTIINKVKLYFKRLMAWLPSPLPVGMTAFQEWASSIVELYGLPDNDSSRWALATQLLHVNATSYYKSKRYFGVCSLKSMANQIAAGVMQDLKAKQAAEQAKAAEAANVQAAV